MIWFPLSDFETQSLVESGSFVEVLYKTGDS